MSNAGGFKSLTRYYDMLAGNTVWNPWSPTGAYDALATVTVPSAGASSITFSGIPTGYKHLQLRTMSLGTNAWVDLKANSTASAAEHAIQGSGSSAAAYANVGNAYSSSIYLQANTTQPNVAIIDILDYANTSKNKTFRTFAGMDLNGDGTVFFLSNLYNSTSAISTLTVSIQTGTFSQYSQFALYGVK